MRPPRLAFSAIVLLGLLFTTVSVCAQTESVLYSFTGDSDDGAFPLSGVVFDGEGNLYGVASYGGVYDWGAAYKLSPASGYWTRKTIYSFNAADGDGVRPFGRLAFHNNALYGVTPYTGVGGCCGVVFELTFGSGAGWQLTVLHTFEGGSDGAYPASGVVFDAAGNLYGTTSQGGVSTTCGSNGCGTVYELTPPAVSGDAWTETVLYSFKGRADGTGPAGALIFDTNGALYGTATGGGTSNGGVVYQLSPPATSGATWKQSVLYSFKGGQYDGAAPTGELVFDHTNNLFGATFGGGPYVPACYGSCGTVFKLTRPSVRGAAWTEKLIHKFGSGSDGRFPSGGTVMDSSGALYGTTYGGGNNFECEYSGDYSGCGTIYKLTKSTTGNTWNETIVHNFGTEISDGSDPNGGLLFDSSGNLYGTTQWGSQNNECGCGTVFEITP